MGSRIRAAGGGWRSWVFDPGYAVGAEAEFRFTVDQMINEYEPNMDVHCVRKAIFFWIVLIFCPGPDPGP